ncbi:unnamed protein product [Spirodela intermedia]|uniref:Uncharacterized protein n=1 Tax=Spirodela intermedia TaxID=51605 RepID=A0A7I8JQJ0_SPIIN|nr:unnamed protein product [Spirodela intermedia]CAA6672410.1 unnamed protein product [Spirodela intermedia]
MKKNVNRHQQEVEYDIITCIGCLAYRLQLPPQLPIHLVFHISLLKAYYADVDDLEHNQPRHPPPMVQTHYDQVETPILDHQVINKGGRNHAHCNTFYLVQWAEQPREATTWEKEVDL